MIKKFLESVKAYITVILKVRSLIFFLFERAKSELQKNVLIKILQYVNLDEKSCPTILSLRKILILYENSTFFGERSFLNYILRDYQISGGSLIRNNLIEIFQC